MKYGLKMQQGSDQNPMPYLSNITNRINYLEHKNQSVNKKLLAYMNNFERRLLSQRSQDSQPNDKTCSTFRINNPSKKINLKSETGKQKSNIRIDSMERKTGNRNSNKTELQGKFIYLKSLKNLKSQKSKKQNQFILRENLMDDKSIENEDLPLQSLKRGRKFLDRTQNMATKESFYPNQQPPKSIVKTNNFFISPSISKNKFPYTEILSTLNKEKEKNPNQQKLKLISIKKKLLEEEEKSLVEYEKCVLYKQKLVQKIKYEQLGLSNLGTETKKKTIDQSEMHIYANDDDDDDQ